MSLLIIQEEYVAGTVFHMLQLLDHLVYIQQMSWDILRLYMNLAHKILLSLAIVLIKYISRIKHMFELGLGDFNLNGK